MSNKFFRIKFVFIIPLCCGFFSFETFGQEIIFKGLVKNSDGKLLENVIVSKKYKNKQAEASTISGGNFSITLSDTSNLMSVSFSYLGYQTIVIEARAVLSFIRINANADYIIILKQKSIDLNQVTIEAKTPFYQKENLLVLDYEIMKNGNLLLIMEKKILLINQQDSILKSQSNPNGINEIIKACSGRIFLRNEKWLYPTAINDTNFLISNNPVEIDLSLKQINELIACDSVIKIKETVNSHNQKIIYKLQLISNPEIQANFYVAQDKHKIKIAQTDKEEIDNYTGPGVMDDIGFDSHGNDDMFYVVWPQDKKVWVYEILMTKKLYAPIFLHHDSIYIFDHGINKIVVMKYKHAGNTIKLNTVLRDSVTYNKRKGWKKIILQDSYTGEFFTIYKDESIVLTNILLFGNKNQINITLPKEHLFIDKMKIYNHTVYYLWRDRYNTEALRTLYKVKLDEK